MWKRLLTVAIAAGCTTAGLSNSAEAHWWNRCYARAHYAVPSCYGWSHFSYSSLSFPSYAHWYTVGCYHPLTYSRIVYRPIVYQPIVYRPVIRRHVIGWPIVSTVGTHDHVRFVDHFDASSGIDFSDSFQPATESGHWVNDDGAWGAEVWSDSQLFTNANEPKRNSNPSVASSSQVKPTDKTLTWEEAIYGDPNSSPLVRFVSYQSPLANGNDLPNSSPTSVTISAPSSLIDEMVRSGNAVEAYSFMQSLVAANSADASLQLRNAVLSLFAHNGPIAVELVLDRFNTACAAGAPLNQWALGSTVSDYLAESRIDVANTLNEFSRLALSSEETAISQLLIVATLLNLDGESERGRIFAQAAFDQAAETGQLQWNSLITTLLN
ncbi:hypothetical protein SH449x_001120 [Pirellulaceae bacterium SH449]